MNEIQEYIKLAKEALNEPDPVKAHELRQAALEMGRRLGFGDGRKRDEMDRRAI